MKKAISWLKNLRPLKIVTVLALGFCLLFTQACSKVTATQPSPQKAESAYIERNDPTKEYPLNSPRGGMNNFSDVDPRAEAGEKTAETRAKALRDNSKRNIDEKGATSIGKYVDNAREGTPLQQKGIGLDDQVGSSVEELTTGVVKGTKRGIENIKENASNAGEDLVNKGKQTVKNAYPND
jgi:hypothetical protein